MSSSGAKGLNTNTYVSTYIYDHISLTSSENEEMFQAKVVEKIKTRILL